MAERNTVPNLETKATDGNPVFTPRQWLERFQQFCKREHKIDITPLLKGENITDANWNGKEDALQIYTDGETTGENLENQNQIRRSNRNSKKPNRYGSIPYTGNFWG